MNKKLLAFVLAFSFALVSITVAFATETPAETTAAAPAETTASTPAETTASTPAETTASTPAETTVSTPAETTASTPAETTASTPAETTASTPAETTASTPAETTASTPAETTASTPAETTASTPAETTASTPAVTTAPTPAVTTAPSTSKDDGFEMPEDNIDVDARISVKVNSESDWPESEPGEEPTLIVRDGDAVDIRVDLYMDTVITFIEEWYQYGEDMICLATGGDSPSEQDLEFRAMLLDFFNFLPIEGNFTVTIKSSKTINIPDEYTQLGEMEGFNEEAGELFTETDRSFTGKTLTIRFAIREGITMGDLMENREQYFSHMSLTLEGIDVSEVSGDCRLQGKLKGGVVFQIGISESDKHTVRLETDTLVTNLKVKQDEDKDVGSSGTGTGSEKKITFNVDGDTELIEPMYAYGTIDVEELPIPTKTGYKFDGWYTNSKMTKKVEDTLSVSRNMTLYGCWISTASATPLEMDDHYAYIFGYPNGTICPDNNITREEVSMIFYRLLKDDVRTELLTETNDFIDVADDRWSNKAISTMVKGGFLSGRSATKFDPEAYITRAELVTMATRFVELSETSDAQFSDLAGHWAEAYIQKAAAAGWITGDPNGKFRPDDPISRAEAMTLINRVLSRSVNAAGLHKDAKVWSDIAPGDWFYYIVIEATNSHTYTRQEDGVSENWSAILENKTWN